MAKIAKSKTRKTKKAKKAAPGRTKKRSAAKKSAAKKSAARKAKPKARSKAKVAAPAKPAPAAAPPAPHRAPAASAAPRAPMPGMGSPSPAPSAPRPDSVGPSSPSQMPPPGMGSRSPARILAMRVCGCERIVERSVSYWRRGPGEGVVRTRQRGRGNWLKRQNPHLYTADVHYNPFVLSTSGHFVFVAGFVETQAGHISVSWRNQAMLDTTVPAYRYAVFVKHP